MIAPLIRGQKGGLGHGFSRARISPAILRAAQNRRSQNDEHKTTVNVYSLRARSRPTVSTPVTWEEVAATLKARDAKRLVFESEAVLQRVERRGDLFAPLLSLKQKLPPLSALA